MRCPDCRSPRRLCGALAAFGFWSAAILLAPGRAAAGPTLTVTTLSDSGPGSLRAALTAANAAPGATISFNIPLASAAGGVFVLKPLSPLPTITAAGTLVDGSTQTAFTGNTNASGPEIVLDGSVQASGENGLRVQAADCLVKALSIRSFTGAAVVIDGPSATKNEVQDCYLGTDPAGTAAAANGAGVFVAAGAQNNAIGGTAAGQGCLISGNLQAGVWISGTGTAYNSVLGNLVGTTRTGATPLPNQGPGVKISSGAYSNSIGGTDATDGVSDGVVHASNLISGNLAAGVRIQGAGSSQNHVWGNVIGANAAGASALPNSGNGIEITESAASNTIGGKAAGASNLISGNGKAGILIEGGGSTAAHDNQVRANLIGTNAAGTGALPNGSGGVAITSGARLNTIGGQPGYRNLISGNKGAGVSIQGLKTDSNLVEGNYIGTDKSGAAAVPNGFLGVEVTGGATRTVVGGGGTLGNLISGNGGSGIRIQGAGTNDNQVCGNYIGTNALGNLALPNTTNGESPFGGAHGIEILGGAQANRIGTTELGGNLISANELNGVLIDGVGTRFNSLYFNNVGTDSGGQKPLPNGACGVSVEGGAQDNTVGTTGQTHDGATFVAGNLIAFNTEDGIRVSGSRTASPQGNSFRANSIFENGGLGINLVGGSENASGVTANDPGDGDVGPNTLQNYPELSSAVAMVSQGTTVVSGKLSSTPNTLFLIDFYRDGKDPSGFGEGKVYWASRVVGTDASGNAALGLTLPGSYYGVFIAATATSTGPSRNTNTSEFSNAVVAPGVIQGK